MFKTIFKRYEKKYLITEKQKELLLNSIGNYISPDKYGQSTICNIYYDTQSFELIRRSVEKPVYKEKLRLRTYGIPTDDSVSFIELKKKYKGIVYKRRLTTKYSEGFDYLTNGKELHCENKQVKAEIDYFINFYKDIKPTVALFYDRNAYYDKTNPELRLTFDKNIRFRTDNTDLRLGDDGEKLTRNDELVLEIKCIGAMPLWLSHTLASLKIYPVSFSKYGKAYLSLL